MDQYGHSLSVVATIMVLNKCPVNGEQVMVISHDVMLPQQQYNLFKTSLVLALGAYNSKTSSVTPIFYY